MQFSFTNNFIDRGASYKAGMSLLIKHLTESEWKQANYFSARLDLITEKIKALYEDHEEALKDKEISFKAANAKLDRLIASYVSLCLSYAALKDPSKSLGDAGHCAVWEKGRKPFNTPIFLSENSLASLDLVQCETPYMDSDILLEEYSTASKTSWFKWIPQWMQAFVKENSEQLVKQSIPSSLRNIPGLANLSYHEFKVNNAVKLSYFRHATQLPIDLLGKKETDDERFRLTCINVASQIRLSITKKADDLENSELVILSQSLLSPGIVASLKAKFVTVASDNDTQIYAFKEKAIQLFQHALANPEAQIDDIKIKTLFFTPNKQNETLFYKDFLKKWKLIVQDNKTYQYKAYKPVKLTLLSTNNPFNVVRHIGTDSSQDKGNKLNTAQLLGAVARYLAFPKLDVKKDQTKWQNERIPYVLDRLSRPEFDSLLKELIEQLNSCENEAKMARHRESIVKIIENLLSADIKAFLSKNTLQLLHALRTLLSIPDGQGFLSFDVRHKPQLRSVAETLVVNCLGGAVWVACKSGKDRTGGASIANDAAAIYYQKNKKFPQYHDIEPDRKDYLNIYDNLFVSGHQQHVASENAPGANGLVKSSLFFPSDLKPDIKRVERETQLARLNKPKAVKNLYKKSFNHQALNKELQAIKDETVNMTLGESTALFDWHRNWGSYFIDGKSVKTLREDRPFENEEDLSGFIKTHLLAQIENEELKKYYEALVLYSFHHGAFPQAFCKLNMQLMNKYYKEHKQEAIIGQPDIHVNFSCSEDGKGIQIEEISTYKKKKFFGMQDYIVAPEKGGYQCKTDACILIKLNEVKDKGYKLVVGIESAHVDCVDELKPLFFKRYNLLEAFIRYLQLLLTRIRDYFEHLIKPQPILNKNWISEVHSTFFQKSTEKNEEEKKTVQLNSVLQACSPSIN